MTTIYPRHAGKTVLVTGGTQGIGLAVARRFLQEGANVVAADIVETNDYPNSVSDIAAEGQARFVRMDVTDYASVEAGVKAAVDAYGQLDTLICNAGTARFGDIETVSFEDWNAVLDIIVNGTFHCVRAALPALRRTKGSAVSTASISGFGVNYSLNSYFAAKGAIINLTRYMALEYGKAGIRFNAVAPGPINSHPDEGLLFDDPDLVAYYQEVTPLGRVGALGDLPGIYTFLASADASWVTGQTIVADGGLTLWTGEYDLGKVVARMSADG
jgi:meso-butanediol dehydrogenase/(S,S)-butanediol dehydrogenase/diacetyl reductase